MDKGNVGLEVVVIGTPSVVNTKLNGSKNVIRG